MNGRQLGGRLRLCDRRGRRYRRLERRNLGERRGLRPVVQAKHGFAQGLPVEVGVLVDDGSRRVVRDALKHVRPRPAATRPGDHGVAR